MVKTKKERKEYNRIYWAAHKDKYNAISNARRKEKMERDPVYRAIVMERKKEYSRRYRIRNGKRMLKWRFQIFQRDGFRCRYCGRGVEDTTLQIDHVIPRSKGGTNSAENLVTSCKECNIGKSDVLL